MFRVLLYFVMLYTVSCAAPTLEEIIDKNRRLMGVDTVHDAKINKDTVISSMKMGSKSENRKVEEREPDWSYQSFPKEVSQHVASFKKNMSECLKEVQESDKRPVKRLSPKQESPVHGECLIACVLKRNGVIEHGKINKGNLITLVSKFFAKEAKLIKKLDKNLDRCIELSSKARDECTLASYLNSCTNELMESSKRKITVNY